MGLTESVYAFQWIYLLYFSLLNIGYLFLNILGAAAIANHIEEFDAERLPQDDARQDLLPPVSVLVPGFNEEATIVSSVRSLLQLEYPEFEIIVIDDGSRDRTSAVMREAFGMKVFPEAYRQRLSCAPVKTIYRSSKYPNLRLITKANGGKADSLNAGINAAKYPLFCSLDADSILERSSLAKAVRPFLQDSRTIATGGTIRILNGCTLRDGFLERIELPRNVLALFQTVEYLRAYLFGRMGWSPLNALLIISGAFGVFHKETVVQAGGYSVGTIGEDMELVVRLHRRMQAAKRDYKIVFVPDPVCWTEAPESIRVLGRQRVRWQRGLCESLWRHRDLLFNRRGRAVGWLAFPFMVLFEAVGPVIEVLGYVMLYLAWVLDLLSGQVALVFAGLSLSLGILLSVNSLMLEEFSYHIYNRPTQTLKLLGAAVLENFGFRQLNSWWRIRGTWEWLRGREARWGNMERKGNAILAPTKKSSPKI